MIRFWLVGCAVLVIGCGDTSNDGGGAGTGGNAGTGGDAGTGGAGGSDICDTVACDCDTDADCAEHETCDSSVDGRFCVCVAAYEDTGSGCEFTGAPLAPGFDDAAPWTTSGGAMIDAAAGGFDDPGLVTWLGENSLCDASGVSQTFTMPPYSAAEPLALELTYLGEEFDIFDEAEAMVALNEKWTLYPSNDAFSTVTTCLGDSAFGGDVEFRIDGRTDFCPASVELTVDRMEVVRAVDAGLDCPDPGVVRDGDFDGDGSAWEMFGDATVEDGIGQDGSRAGRLQTQTLCRSASLTGLASWPLQSTVPSPALRFYWNGTAGRALNVQAGDFAVATITATGTPSTSTLCLPPSSQGLAGPITFGLPFTGGSCATTDVRDFTIDSVEVVSAPDCGDDPYVLDGDFEFAFTGTVSSGWISFSMEPRGTASIVSGDAESGNASLRLASRQECANISARSTIVVPKPDATGGPALKYFYRVGNNPETVTSSSPGNGDLSEGASEYLEETVCLNPADATKPQTLTFTISPGGGTCAVTFPEEEAFIDNVRLTTDPACPSE